jgi:hypothetical protein
MASDTFKNQSHPINDFSRFIAAVNLTVTSPVLAPQQCVEAHPTHRPGPIYFEQQQPPHHHMMDVSYVYSGHDGFQAPRRFQQHDNQNGSMPYMAGAGASAAQLASHWSVANPTYVTPVSM